MSPEVRQDITFSDVLASTIAITRRLVIQITE